MEGIGNVYEIFILRSVVVKKGFLKYTAESHCLRSNRDYNRYNFNFIVFAIVRKKYFVIAIVTFFLTVIVIVTITI